MLVCCNKKRERERESDSVLYTSFNLRSIHSHILSNTHTHTALIIDRRMSKRKLKPSTTAATTPKIEADKLKGLSKKFQTPPFKVLLSYSICEYLDDNNYGKDEFSKLFQVADSELKYYVPRHGFELPYFCSNFSKTNKVKCDLEGCTSEVTCIGQAVKFNNHKRYFVATTCDKIVDVCGKGDCVPLILGRSNKLGLEFQVPLIPTWIEKVHGQNVLLDRGESSGKRRKKATVKKETPAKLI